MSRAGMAMPAVLGTLIVSALLASAVAHQARSSYRLDVEQHRRDSHEWVVQAGLNRAVRALTTPGDPMREALFGDRRTTWVFGDRRVLLKMSAESEKVDLNAADPDMAMKGLALALPELSQEEKTRIVMRLADLKARHQLVCSPEQLLPLDRRSASISDRLRRLTTTLSGQKRPSTRPHDGETGDGMAGESTIPSQFWIDGDGTPSRPIYRLTATMVADAGSPSETVPLSGSVVIMLSANDAKVFKIAEGHL